MGSSQNRTPLPSMSSPCLLSVQKLQPLSVCVCVSCSVVSYTLRPHGLQPPRLLCPWDSLGKNTGVGSLSLLQGIFPTQGLNPDLPHCWLIPYQLSHKRSPSEESQRQILILEKKSKSQIVQTGGCQRLGDWENEYRKQKLPLINKFWRCSAQCRDNG